MRKIAEKKKEKKDMLYYLYLFISGGCRYNSTRVGHQVFSLPDLPLL